MFYVDLNNPGIILLIILGIFGLIALITFIVYRLLHPKLKDQNKIDEKEAVKQELNRLLEPVDDEKTAEEIKNYKSPEDEDK